MISSREIALKILYEIEVNQKYSNIELNKQLTKNNISPIDKHFITELVYGIIKWKLKIDWIIEHFSNIKLNKISPWIINILRIGIFQIEFLDKIPHSAAVNESVKLAKKYGHKGSVGFVNAVLRNFIRNQNKIKYPDKSDAVQYLSVMYSHPKWMVKKWLNRYGFEFTEGLCKSNNDIPPLSIRVNTLKCTIEELKEKLKIDGVKFEDGKYFKDCSIIVKSDRGISDLQSFKDGLFQVQDESSMLVGAIINPLPGQTIVDVCAAPGGKSTHIAQLMKNQGKIYSRDIYEHKIKLIEDNARRLGIDIILTKVFDATKLDEELVEKADGVVVDVPCSGLGIIRRKPDIKWNKQVTDKSDLINIQKAILDTASKYVKSGGVIVYSTCTIEEDENLGIVKDFLSNNKNFSLIDISNYIPKGLVKDTCKDGYIQTYPNVDGIDGFFVAKMMKN